MFKRILYALGLQAAPRPIRSFITASSFVGTLPALAFVAWRYRDRIVPALGSAKRLVARTPSTAQPVAAAL
jgi:ABC-type hemin transport system substrate-binding protein